jgi:kinesin family member 22
LFLFVTFRIIEIEWAVKNGRPFELSPKRGKKSKTRKAKSSSASSRSSKGENTHSLHSENATVGESSSRQEASTTTMSTSTDTSMTAKARATDGYADDGNSGSGEERDIENVHAVVLGGDRLAYDPESLQVGSPPKRPIDEMRGDDSIETPPRHRKLKKVAVEEGVDDGAWAQWEPFAPIKRGRQETTT